VAKVVELLPPFRAGASLYSYGDSAGISPASLLIPIPITIGMRKPIGCKCRRPEEKEKFILITSFRLLLKEKKQRKKLAFLGDQHRFFVDLRLCHSLLLYLFIAASAYYVFGIIF